MGIGVSGWRLARAVSRRGQLGVVSGTALDTVLVRRLQEGDPGGHLRRAMAQFPLPGVAAEVLQRYFRPEGLPPETQYKLLPMYREGVSRFREQVTMLANFVEVWLAREGHDGPVGINLLTKIQFPTLASLYGAMLAGVDCVLMGAGIPREIPAVLDAFAEHQPAAIRLEVEGLPPGETRQMRLDPAEHWSTLPAGIPRPAFLPIIASNSLATVLARKASGRVDGFIIEGPTAGGHNAPPRGETRFNERGEPIYGERDVVDLPKMTELGLPFWLAGGTGKPGRLQEAQRAGATGIQVGTLFAYCDESDLREDLKRSVLEHVVRGEVEIFTDPQASPTGYPFKVVHWADDPGVAALRERICDLGYLRVAYFTPDGKVDYRCASEPVDAYVRKGGKVEETEGRRCLCNALLANIGHAQFREGGRVEPPLLTSGDDLQSLSSFLAGRARYSAAEVIDYLLADVSPPTSAIG
jgi:NAD(P)H-dependent flavin oxidoreductase YrpB (nitropropane dioxygenase family)